MTNQERLDRFLPIRQYQYVDVTFPSSANADHVITHNLKVENPEDVNYQVVRSSAAGVVYHDQSASRRAWQQGFIILRASVASLTVRLLLTVEPE